MRWVHVGRHRQFQFCDAMLCHIDVAAGAVCLDICTGGGRISAHRDAQAASPVETYTSQSLAFSGNCAGHRAPAQKAGGSVRWMHMGRHRKFQFCGAMLCHIDIAAGAVCLDVCTEGRRISAHRDAQAASPVQTHTSGHLRRLAVQDIGRLHRR